MKNTFRILLKTTLTLCFLIFWAFNIQAQQKADSTSENSLVLRARFLNDSIVLRWGFNNADKWALYDSAGFIVERLELDEQNKPVTNQFIRKALVKSWSSEMFLSRTPNSDTLTKMAAQCLYGKNFTMSLSGKSLTESLKDAAQVYENKFRFAQFAADLSPRAAQGLGWRWVDTDVKKNRKYIYRLFSSTKLGTDSAGYIISTKEFYALQAPQGFKNTNGDRVGLLKWQHNESYSAYWIEKSTDGVNFKAAVKTPYVGFSDDTRFYVEFRDSLVQNYKNVYYRVYGFNAFGEKSPLSNIQILGGRDLKPPPAAEIQSGIMDKKTHQTRIDWSWEGKDLADLKGFNILYSRVPDGNYNSLNKNLLPKNTRQFITEPTSQIKNGYYKVVAVDTAGNEAASHFKYVFLNDLDPPSKPKGLIGKIDTNGKVIISWAKPIETDVKGYAVQFANALDHPFVGRSNGVIEDTVFTDSITLHTLTEKIYYRIAAVDFNENVSAFSDVLTLKKPDIIKPVPPNFYDYRATDSTIFLAWHPSASEDAVKQRIYRKLVETLHTTSPQHTTSDSKGEMIAEMDNTKSTFTDRPPTNNLYAYSIEAEDDDGLRSVQNDPIFLKLIDDRKLKSTPQLFAAFDAKTKMIHLTWKFTAQQKINYLIYRAVNDAPLEHIKTISGETLLFDDAKVATGTKYRYAIKAIENNERESKLSDVVKVAVN